MPLYYVFYQRKSQTNAAVTLGGEERLQNHGQLIRRYPSTVVRNGHAKSISVLSAPFMGFVHSRQNSPAFGHGIGGVQHEIGK